MGHDFEFLGSFPPDQKDAIKKYHSILLGYKFTGINLSNASIDVATDVFTRLNVGGKELNIFEIMVAKTYDATKKFDLSEKYEELKKELKKVEYGDIPSQTVLQVIAMLIQKDIKRASILKIDKSEFISMWEKTVDCIKRSVDFFRGYGIEVFRLLPYSTLIVPFSYFFYKHPRPPSGRIIKQLEDFFWRISLGMRYSSAVESKVIQDVEKIDKIIAGQQPYYEWSIDVSPEKLMSKEIGQFSTGKSVIKGLLCLFALHKPKSFNNNQFVRIDSNSLKQSNSKNYHHFFPRDYMKKNYPDMSEWKYNHILNITIVDDFLNKVEIRTKDPSGYITEFNKINQELPKTMRTHLIGDFEKFGILENNYERFFRERAKIVSKELSKRLIEQETGYEVQGDEGADEGRESAED